MLGEYTLQRKLAPQCCIDYTSLSDLQIVVKPIASQQTPLISQNFYRPKPEAVGSP